MLTEGNTLGTMCPKKQTGNLKPVSPPPAPTSRKIKEYRQCSCCLEDKPVYEMDCGGWWYFSNYHGYTGSYCHECAKEVLDKYRGVV